MSNTARALLATTTALTALGLYKNRENLQKIAKSPGFADITNKVKEIPETLKNISNIQVKWDDKNPNSHFPFSVSFDEASTSEKPEDSSSNTPGR